MSSHNPRVVLILFILTTGLAQAALGDQPVPYTPPPPAQQQPAPQQQAPVPSAQDTLTMGQIAQNQETLMLLQQQTQIQEAKRKLVQASQPQQTPEQVAQTARALSPPPAAPLIEWVRGIGDDYTARLQMPDGSETTIRKGDVLPTADGTNTVESIDARGVVIKWYGRKVHLSQLSTTPQNSNQTNLQPSLFPPGAVPANVEAPAQAPAQTQQATPAQPSSGSPPSGG